MSLERTLFLSWLLLCESTTYNDNVCIIGYETMDNNTLVENKKDEIVDDDSIESFQVWKQDTPQDVSSFAHILQAPEASPYWRGVYTSRAAKYWEDFYKRHANRFFHFIFNSIN